MLVFAYLQPGAPQIARSLEDVVKVRALMQCLSDTHDIHVAKHSECPREKGVLFAIALNKLIFQKPNDCLGCCKSPSALMNTP
jgi:hypothetical protein